MLLVVAVAAAGGGWWRWRATRNAPKVLFETATVDRGRLTAKVTATGTLSALVTVQVGSQVSGRVRDIFVDFNSPVQKGQVIAKIDPQLFDAALEQARANYLAAQANLTKARVQAQDAQRQHDRARSLLDRKLIAQADFDTLQANLEVAQAQIEAAQGSVAQAKASLHQAQVNRAYTDIVSPTNGTVISRSVDVGQTVAASLQSPTLFQIAEDLRKMQVDTSVAEADVGKLRAGMPATFTVDAYPGERFVGKVRQIRNAPQTVQNVVTYDAVIDVDNGELKLKPGMTANVTFIYAENDSTLRVANAALRFRPSTDVFAALGMSRPAAAGESPRPGAGGSPRAGRGPRGDRSGAPSDRRTLWLLEAGQPRSVAVRVGISDGTSTELVEAPGVSAGSVAITDAQLPGKSSAGPPGGPPGAGPPGGGLRRVF